MSWELIKLGHVLEFSNGVNFDKSSYAPEIKLINVSNFGSRFYPDYSELAEISESVVKENDYLQNGDIVFVRSNGNKELVGRCMLINNPPRRTTCSGFCIRARIKNSGQLDSKFLTYHFKSNGFRTAMAGNAVGANIQNLSQGRLSAYTAYIPPIEIQRRIADILSAYDDLIENNRKQIKLLEEAAQRLYKEWFVDLRFPGHEYTKIVDGVPEGWRKGGIDSKIQLLSGYAFKSAEFTEKGIYKIVTIKNVKDGQFDGDIINRIAEIPSKMPKHCQLTDGDILVSLTGNVGRVCIIHGKNYLLNQRVAKLKSDFPAYTYCLFRSKDMFNEMDNLANGAAQQNLSPIRVGKVQILFPDDVFIRKFEKMMQPVISKIILLNREIDRTTQARDRLLPKLMSGEIEV